MEQKQDKSRYQFAREVHMTFAGIGGGLHLGILAFMIYSTFIPDPGDSITVIYMILATLHVAIAIIVWLRMYWMYINAMMFFAPFDNIWLFSIDMLGFFSAALCIFFVGHIIVWFFTFAFVLLIIAVRIKKTITKSHELSSKYPRSFEKLQVSLSKVFRCSVISACSSIIFGLVIIFCHVEVGLWQIAIVTAQMFISSTIWLRNISPLYPIEQDFSDHNS